MKEPAGNRLPGLAFRQRAKATVRGSRCLGREPALSLRGGYWATIPAVLCGWGIILAGGAGGSAAADRPHILWISCEDIGPHLGCYGHRRAITPTLDRLARRGTRYTHAFTTAPVCAPNRSAIITGMVPTTIGTHHMRSQVKLPDHIRCFPHYLRAAGYHCSNRVKTDYNFPVPAGVWDENSPQADWRSRRPDQPFFHIRNFANTHESQNWPRGQEHRRRTRDLTVDQRQDPAGLELPPYYPDTPEVRRDWANYFENITQLDYHVAGLLRQLEEDGLAEETIVFFWSDHGVGLPRGKRWLYDSGTRVPLLVFIPQKYRRGDQGRPGSVSDQLISFIDLAPTVLNLCDVPLPAHLQGQPFLGPDLPPPRPYVVSVRDRMDERYDMLRTVRDKRYRYIRNYMPWKPYAQWLKYAERNETMKALRRRHTAGELNAVQARFLAREKPFEEFYDCVADPHELHNLALEGDGDDETQGKLSVFRERLNRWQRETRDLGFFAESVLESEQEKLGSRWAILRDPAASTTLAEMILFAAQNTYSQPYLTMIAISGENPLIRQWGVAGLAWSVQGSPQPEDREKAVQ
ncbi:MAG: sulfatase-like hydrolase/transferase, partial [Planctomycetales bacterium]|nr:sulfatase-like hydrolase/transferase [Planctomycetales bacterium]